MYVGNGWQSLLFFACGAVLYPSLEVLWRGYSHYSMALAGGLCGFLLYGLNALYPHVPLLLRAAAGAGIITLVEFIFGVVFNLFLGMRVWDYSDLPFNLLGQVSLRYTLLWFLFSLVLAVLIPRFFLPGAEGA